MVNFLVCSFLLGCNVLSVSVKVVITKSSNVGDASLRNDSPDVRISLNVFQFSSTGFFFFNPLERLTLLFHRDRHCV